MNKDALLREVMRHLYHRKDCQVYVVAHHAKCDCGIDALRARITAALEDKSGGWIPVPKVAGWYWISDSDGWRIVEVFKRPGHDYLAIAAPQTGMGKRDFDPVAKMPDAKWNGPLPIPPLPKGE